MIGMRKLDKNEYEQFKAASVVDMRSSTRSIDDYDIYKRLERNFTLIGCVALEDKL